MELVKIPNYQLLPSNTLNGQLKLARQICYVKNGIRFNQVKLKDDLFDLVAIDVANERFVGFCRPFKIPDGQMANNLFDLLITTLEGLSCTDKLLTVGGF